MRLDDAPAPRAGGMSGWTKVLIGCGCGCGAVIIAMILAGGIASVWAFKPGKQIATERIIGEDSVGAARAGELAEDPGTQELLTHVVRRVDEIDRATTEAVTPDSLHWLSRMRRQPQGSDLNTMIPSDVTLTLERVSDQDEVAVVAAMNFRAMVRPIAAMFSFVAKQDHPERHRVYNGHDVYGLYDNDDNSDGDGDGGAVVWVDSTLIYSTSNEALERVLDRIADGAAGPANPPSKQVDLEGAWDLAGRFRNDDNMLVAWLSEDETETEAETETEPETDIETEPETELPLASEDLELQFGIDIATGDLVRAQLLLTARDTAEAVAWLPVLEERLKSLEEEAREHGLVPVIDVRVQGERVWADIELTGLEAAVMNALRPDLSLDVEEYGVEEEVEGEDAEREEPVE